MECLRTLNWLNYQIDFLKRNKLENKKHKKDYVLYIFLCTSLHWEVVDISMFYEGGRDYGVSRSQVPNLISPVRHLSVILFHDV